MARQLLIELLGNAANLRRALRDAEGDAQSFGERIGRVGTKMTAFVSVPIVGFLAAAGKAGAEDAAAQAILAKTLENVAGANEKVVASVEEYIGSAMKQSTFTDDELRPAFGRLVASSGDVERSMQLLNIAMDVATGAGIPLEQATLAVAKASEGQFTAVNRLIPGLLDMNDKTLTAETAVRALSETFSGQAAAATETAAGKMQNLTRDIGELVEGLGAKLLPIMDKVIGAVSSLVDGFGSLPDPVQDAFLVLLGLAAAAGPILKVVEVVVKLRAALVAANIAAGTLVATLAPLLAAGFLASEAKRAITDPESRKGRGLLGTRSPIDLIAEIGDRLNPFHTGGVVPGSPGQEVPIMALAGETVIPAGQGTGVTVVVNVAGSVTSERALVDAIQAGLLAKQRRSGNLGFVGA